MASMSAYPQLHQSTATSPVPESGYHIHSPNHLQLLQLQHMQHMQMHMSKAQTHVGNPQPGPAQAQAQAQQQYLDSHSQAYIAHQGPGIPPISSPGAAAADSSFVTVPAPAPTTGHKKRKRKAESQDAPGNERLSKRLSLLNLGTSVVLAPRRRSSYILYSVSESGSESADSAMDTDDLEPDY